MSDDPFLAKPQEHMTPAEPSVQPTPPDVSAPAQYQPPQPPVPYQPGAPGGVPTPYAQAPYAQAHYPPAQPGYPPPPPVPYYGPQSKPKTWMNWVALGCGIAMFVTCISGIAAIVFGHLGIAAANRGEADAKGAGIAGLVLGYLSVVALVAYIFIFAAMIGSAGFQ